MTVDRIIIIAEKDGVVYQFFREDWFQATELCEGFKELNSTKNKFAYKADLISKVIKNKHGKVAK